MSDGVGNLAGLRREYSLCVTALLTFAFFLNFPGYTGMVDWGVPRLPGIVLLFLFTLPLVLMHATLLTLPRAFACSLLLPWCFAYLLTASVSLASAAQHAHQVDAFLQVLASVGYLLGLSFLFSNEQSMLVARQSILAAVLISVPLYLLDLAFPYLLVPAEHEFAGIGRATGLHGNANRAGAAVVIGTLIGLRLIPQRWRALFLAYSLLGTLVTFSRAALVAWAVVAVGAAAARWLRVAPVVLAGLAVGLLLVSAVGMMSQHLTAVVGNDMELWELWSRIVVWQLGESSSDASLAERARVAVAAWGMFEEQPLFGAGIGVTRGWSEDASTHNMYLLFLAEYGLLGLVLFLVLFACIAHGNGDANEKVIFALVLAALALTTHNMLEEPFYLVSIALMSTWRTSNRDDPTGSDEVASFETRTRAV